MKSQAFPCLAIALVLTGIMATVSGIAEADCLTVVEVCAIPNDPEASGDLLLERVAAILDASWGKRYLVKVSPGVFSLGTQTLAMKEWVDIEGSGREATVIQGMGTTPPKGVGLPDMASNRSDYPSVIIGASHAELRDVGITSYGTAGTEYNVAVVTEATTKARFSNIRIASWGGASCWGFRLSGGSGQINDVDISLDCTGYTSGISALSSLDPTVFDIQHATIRSTGSSLPVGVWLDDGSIPSRFEHVNISAVGPAGQGTGVWLDNYFGTATDTLVIFDSRILTGSAGTGIKTLVPLSLKMAESRVEGGLYGIHFSSLASGDVFIDQSMVAGSTNTVYADSGLLSTMNAGASGLFGGPVSATGATLRCASVYDESYVNYARTCP